MSEQKVYKVLQVITDLEDNDRRYDPGKDLYPREGLEPSEERVQALLKGHNRQQRPVIGELEEADYAHYGLEAPAPNNEQETADPVDYSKMKKDELLQEAEALGVEVDEKMTKDEIIAQIKSETE
ncbi:hypothetical protein [Salinicoccus roseus]|uniref:hypothetical protein n=1 Tax=Salinicoccus roseus TaxID=45670 RepID=UPI0022FFE241|nr:hypothetical protein [Salinicoccus roseus]